MKKLAELDIEPFNGWQYFSPRITWQDYPVAYEMKRSLLALPLHQQQDEADSIPMGHCLVTVVGSGNSVS